MSDGTVTYGLKLPPLDPKTKASVLEVCQRAYKACRLHSFLGWHVVIPECAGRVGGRWMRRAQSMPVLGAAIPRRASAVTKGDGVYAFACDTCCGHGCEDGKCVPVGDSEALAAMVAAAEVKGG